MADSSNRDDDFRDKVSSLIANKAGTRNDHVGDTVENPSPDFHRTPEKRRLSDLISRKADTRNNPVDDTAAELSDDSYRTPEKRRSKSTPSDSFDDNLSFDPDRSWKVLKSEQNFFPVQTKAAAGDGSSIGGGGAHGYTRIVCVSDTHGHHRDIAIPRGNILIHGGDFTNTGEPKQVEDLSLFFKELDYIPHIVCIAGNHDLTFQPDHYACVSRRFHGRWPLDCGRARSALRNCTYLEDSSVDIDGVRVYGSPWQPWFHDWAFNLSRGSQIRSKWALIPSSTDVLVTHGPPLGRGDLCGHGGRAGCYDLLREVQDRVRPRLHVFGHIHEGYGVSFDGTTLFVNASGMTMSYAAHNPAIVVDLPNDPTLPALVVEPDCSFTGPQVIEWLQQRGYGELVPFFRAATPALVGKDLISFDEDWLPDICQRLSLDRAEHRKSRRQLAKVLMQLRAESY